MNTPVLLIIFNRPDTTKQVFAAVRAARPSRLYVAADGPRDVVDEARRCEQARQVATAVDWPCEVRTMLSDRNLGCREGPIRGITWFFDCEEAGIILEDDCVPAPSFFPYCQELLDRFRNDERVMCISGDNFQESMGDYPYSYYFSKIPQTWGWASWRRAWRMYDTNMSGLAEFIAMGGLNALSTTPIFLEYWQRCFHWVRSGADAWDYQWTFACWAQSGLTCTPRVNLVTNVGFGANATHTIDSCSKLAALATKDLDLPLIHPTVVAPHRVFDSHVDKVVFGVHPVRSGRKLRSIPGRVRRKLITMLHRPR